MNLSAEEMQLSDEELCDRIGFDTLVRFGLINWNNQIRRRQDVMRKLGEEIERRGLDKVKH